MRQFPFQARVQQLPVALRRSGLVAHIHAVSLGDLGAAVATLKAGFHSLVNWWCVHILHQLTSRFQVVLAVKSRFKSFQHPHRQ